MTVVKKIFSILLLAVLLFNLVGYRLLISFLEDKANLRLEARLDEDDYDQSQLISVKIPVTYLPYYNNSSSFERIDGELEIAGVHYKYVKRRIQNDSLELLCIPNTEVMNLKEVNNEFFKFVNDLQHNGQNKNPGSNHKSATGHSTDYYNVSHLFGLYHLSDITPEFSSFYIICRSFPYYPTAERPPQNA